MIQVSTHCVEWDGVCWLVVVWQSGATADILFIKVSLAAALLSWNWLFSASAKKNQLLL
jgi:hypothetical protein